MKRWAITIVYALAVLGTALPLNVLVVGCSYNEPCQSSEDCGLGELCTVDGKCISDCVPECGTRECGPDPVCLVSCGKCGAGEVCDANGECKATPGPRIFVDVNIRNLCNYGVSVEVETRCITNDDCGGTQFCWGSPESHFSKGFCRDCETDAQCPTGEGCDHGWCHTRCTQSTQLQDCPAGEYCTGGFCRKPHTVGGEFELGNAGTENLEVYLNQTRLYGNREACVFSRFEWVPDQPTVILAPDEFGLYLLVRYTPADVGEFRGVLEIHSNAVNYNPLYIFLCGQAVEAVCYISEDFSCPDCASCLQADFEEILSQKPEPDCTGFFD